MVGRVTAEALERRLGWRDGLLILNGETLAEAAREFNHYNDLQIEVSGGTADLRVVGAFRNTDPEAFAGTMHDLFGVGVRRLPDRITITDARVVS
jgi:transmembrane sensor